MTDKPLFFLIAAALLVVTIILAVGIGGFGAGGAFNARHGNRMMRWRIIAQAGAILAILVFVTLRG